MTKLQRWFLIIALWMVILIFIFTFYWFQVRPSRIRQICSKEASRACAEVKSNLANMLEVNQAVYAHCLKRNGVVK